VIGQRYTTAPQAAIFLSTEAVFAALFGALILGDRLPPGGLVGCALIFAAILIVELVPQLSGRARSTP
jgi:drug/metabolite transporter (DMT)-like permease